MYIYIYIYIHRLVFVPAGGDGQLYTWGRNEHWQLGYEVSGLLNSGQVNLLHRQAYRYV